MRSPRISASGRSGALTRYLATSRLGGLLERPRHLGGGRAVMRDRTRDAGPGVPVAIENGSDTETDGMKSEASAGPKGTLRMRGSGKDTTKVLRRIATVRGEAYPIDAPARLIVRGGAATGLHLDTGTPSPTATPTGGEMRERKTQSRRMRMTGTTARATRTHWTTLSAPPRRQNPPSACVAAVRSRPFQASTGVSRPTMTPSSMLR